MVMINKKLLINEEEEEKTPVPQKDDKIMKLVFLWTCLVCVLLFELFII